MTRSMAYWAFFGPKLQSRIRPSYETPLLQAFMEVFLSHNSSTGRLELLGRCSSHDSSDWPSWVPDWRTSGNSHGRTPGIDSQASGLSSSHFEEKRTGELEVTGVLLGSVSSVFEVPGSDQGDHVGSWLRKLLKECENLASDQGNHLSRSLRKLLRKRTRLARYPTGETIKEAFAKSLCNNWVRERFPEQGNSFTTREWQDTLDMVMARKKPTLADESHLDGFIRSHLDF